MAQQKAVEAPAEELEDLVDELQPGTKLLKGQYTITRYLNSGGFGITYLAKDSLDRDVVIKECFPSSFCRRSKAMVSARSRAHSAELRSVVQLFVREARSLAKIIHPNIVAVHQVFEDNGTAYMAIDYVDGLDLQQIIDGQGTMPTVGQIVYITEKLLEAVGYIHQNDMLHRDISPDNVLIARNGEPILIDFGAAREQASKTNRAMSALRVVKDGYSPQEFYIAGSEQGPWSDLYALGATLYHLIAGEAPVNGQARLAALAEDRPDPYQPLDGRFQGYPPGFLNAIDTALKTLPKQRVQSAQEWLALFEHGPAHPMPLETGASVDPVAAAVHELVEVSRTTSAAIADAPVAPTPPSATPLGTSPQPVRPVSAQRPSASVQAADERPRKAGGGLVQVAAGIVAALAVVGGVLIFLGDKSVPSADAPVVIAAAAGAPPSGGALAPAPASSEPAAGAPVEVAPAVTEPAVIELAAAEPVVTEPAAAEPAAADPVAAEPAAIETPAAAEPVPTPAAEPQPVETAAATAEPVSPPAEPQPVAAAETEAAPVAAQPSVAPATLVANQVGFAAWDVEMPFIEGNRLVANRRVAVIERILPKMNLAEVGTWLAPGLLIHAINGVDVQQSGSIATGVLNALNVDPDGRARVVVQYSSPSGREQLTGLLTVKAKRRVSLANGVTLSVSNVDGEWRTVVDSVAGSSATDLAPGDVLFRDKTTGLALDGALSLEKIMQDLVQRDTRETEFSIIRNNRVSNASMQLVTR